MPYIEVVVNYGTVASGEAKAPEFDLTTSNASPHQNETIELTALVKDGNTSGYAYSWFIDEQPLTSYEHLNKTLIRQSFSGPGAYVIRAVVSDMHGGIASRNLMIHVEGFEQTNQSSLTGTVRTKNGTLQGARVVLEEAPFIEHNVSLSGNLYNLFFPDGESSEPQFSIDGEIAPQLHFHRGEVHRFNMDSSVDGLVMSFLETPEYIPPSVRINMLADPQADTTKGSEYLRAPKVSYTFRSGFNNYFTNKTGTYLEMLEFLRDRNGTINQLSEHNGTRLNLLNYLTNNSTVINSFSSENQITRPYTIALMQESNVSIARVGPTEINELGYFTYGGRGYHRDNTPIVEVRRSSIWEDYSKRSANATAYIDGVGTLSPVNADEFLDKDWVTRPGDSEVPEVVIWGAGGGDDNDPYDEANATVIAWSDSANGNTMRTVNILNQGKGFEPNSTMAVLHYPLKPKGYWTFNRHESLFEDSNQARYLPSPAWNRPQSGARLKHHWKFDANQSNEIQDEKGNVNLVHNGTISEDDFTWGLLGKSLELEHTSELGATDILEDNCTFSIWIKPSANFTITLGGQSLAFDATADPQTYTLGAQVLSPKIANYWTHLCVVTENNASTLYIDGRGGAASVLSTRDVVIQATNGSLLLDEAKVYRQSASENEVRYLAGRTALDLSKNKYHGVLMGAGAYLETPGTGSSSTDVPSGAAVVNSPNGSGKLGDSYSGEEHGLSLSLNGSDQYFDMLPHASQLSLPVGTISIWVRPNALPSTAPLFTMATPYIAALKDDNSTIYEISESGSIFSFELTNGWPMLAGRRAFQSRDKLSKDEWTHLVGSFDGADVVIWKNGEKVELSNAQPQSPDRFIESPNLLNLASNAKLFAAGMSYSREDDPLAEEPSKIFFNGSIDDLVIYERILTDAEVNYLYDLRLGREQIPRLEAVVDAVGSVIINEGGEGYRENPDLVFWYGQKEFESNLTSFNSLLSVENNFTDGNGDYNGSAGQLVYVDGSVDFEEEGVWVFHVGKDTNRSYNWKKGGSEFENAWRRQISAQGIVEFENASLGDVVWAKRMEAPVEVPMPDGRTILRRFVDYVSIDQGHSLPLEMNSFLSWPFSYFQPNGLYGFNEALDLLVESPQKHNPEALLSSQANAFVYFHIDQDANETISIVTGGHGVSKINENQVKISGPGYRPSIPSPTAGTELSAPSIYGQTQQDYSKDANITILDANKPITGIGIGDKYSIFEWTGTHDVNVSLMEFNRTYSSVPIENPGFGYSMPVKLKVIGGLPQLSNMQVGLLDPNEVLEVFDHSTRVFREAKLEVSSIDQNGAITDITIIDPGTGYIPYTEFIDLDGDGSLDTPWVDPESYPFTQYPLISVTGGGGHGANVSAFVTKDGNITGFRINDGGRGYFNIDTNNRPTAKHTPTLSAVEKNATLEVRLGGYLQEIPRCNLCILGSPEGHFSPKYSHLEPWIEIWDRGRSETDIDQKGVRSFAVPKVVEGNISKVVVLESGSGYIDPVAYVRDAPPKHHLYHHPDQSFRRKWKCTFERVTTDGQKIECGHVHWDLYPPEECPGETDDQFPYLDENGSLWPTTGNDIQNWKTRHNSISPSHDHCTENQTHLNARFLVRKCWGTKSNYILHDDAIYRNPRSDWLEFDANLSVIVEDGKIQEIVVNTTGSNYYASQVHVVGTGSDVDAIPVFDEYGLNTRVIFDDPRLKNLEFDKIDRPTGAGQGFTERPWAWDMQANRVYSVSTNNTPSSAENSPSVGYSDRVTTLTRHSEFTFISGDWGFGTPMMADALGDRILKVEVMDPGLYKDTTDLTNVTIDFNASVAVDHDGDGQVDFIPAVVSGLATDRLTRFVLDTNGTYVDTTSDTNISRGLFTETPVAQILDGALLNNVINIGNTERENPAQSAYIVRNSQIGYDPSSENSFIELYVDDRFPAQLYYSGGNEILVSEGLPGLNWTLNEGLYKPRFSYTDQFGNYAFGKLDPGMYTVSVFMEDHKFQETTFRPEANVTRVSQILYVPGFPELTLETDSVGFARSRLIWSRESRKLSQPDATFPFKEITGIGRGFAQGKTPELFFEPFPNNIGRERPNVSIQVLANGSLELEIVDDENTSRYYPDDRFYVRYSSKVSGVDFFESYLFSESNQSFDSGVLASWEYNSTKSNRDRYIPEPRLVLSPSDANGTNPIEILLSTVFHGDNPNLFRAEVFEANGSRIVSPVIDWNITSFFTDFNASDGNNSRIAQLEDENGNRDLNASGEVINLYLFSTLRSSVGSVKSVEILAGGTGYSAGDQIFLSGDGYGFDANVTTVDVNGSISAIVVNKRGFGYSENTTVSIMDESGTNPSSGNHASVSPIFYRGELVLDVNTTVGGAPLRTSLILRPSLRNQLNSKEIWLNTYLDSFKDINMSSDSDSDGLTNYEEWQFGTDPLHNDTDEDNYTDWNETNPSVFFSFTSNPLRFDTDGDGLSDWEETNSGNDGLFSNPRLKDTDFDGLKDSEDNLPLNASGDFAISGKVYTPYRYASGTLYLKKENGPWFVPTDSQTETEAFSQTHYWRAGLIINGAFGTSAFIDINSDGSYSEGEPYDEQNITNLTTNIYGLNLVPLESISRNWLHGH